VLNLSMTCRKLNFGCVILPVKTSSFRLQTSKDWFYPDFLVQLNDGRVLVVEYKGGYLYDAADAEEKRMVGEVWASRSNGKCLFYYALFKTLSRNKRYHCHQIKFGTFSLINGLRHPLKIFISKSNLSTLIFHTRYSISYKAEDDNLRCLRWIA